MRRFNIHGWDNLSGDNPEVVRSRDEVLRQLAEVPEPHRSAWGNRLKSKLDHQHFSVRLEIYLHHFLMGRGWTVKIEPSLLGTSNRPDFVVHTVKERMIVEAKTVLGAESERHQDSRLNQLMDDLSGKLNRTVLIHPMFDLPSSLPNKRIAAQIEKRASEVELLQEFLIEGEHQGQPYSLEVTVMLEDKPSATVDVGATIGRAVEVDVGHPVRKAIQDKARKYGEIDVPFAIAIWPKLPTHFSSADDDDMVALYGDKVWTEVDYGNFREMFKPNGVFTVKRNDGTRRYTHVSAVLICHPDAIDYSLRVYHNPFAICPIGMHVFADIPQCTIDLITRKVRWAHQQLGH